MVSGGGCDCDEIPLEILGDVDGSDVVNNRGDFERICHGCNVGQGLRGTLVLEHLNLGGGIGIPERDPTHEPIDLAFWESVGSVGFKRVLSGNHHEG
jgi:hypothetical protein